VADDHEGNRRLFSDTLTALGYTVVIAQNGAEAVALAAKSSALPTVR
jgi:CheY-like chemotaxis protein